MYACVGAGNRFSGLVLVVPRGINNPVMSSCIPGSWGISGHWGVVSAALLFPLPWTGCRTISPYGYDMIDKK